MLDLTTDPTALLKKGLLINALFSSFCALLMLINAPSLAQTIGVVAPVDLYAIGGFLAVFAARLFMIAKNGRVHRYEILAIIVADLLWVVGSIDAVLLVNGFTTVGVYIVSVVALLVLCFSLIQFLGMRRLQKHVQQAPLAS